MSSKIPFPPAGFDELTADEQVEYVQELWDYIVDSRSGQISIPDWHREILEERMAQYRENGDEGIPFEQFEKELFEQLKKGWHQAFRFLLDIRATRRRIEQFPYQFPVVENTTGRALLKHFPYAMYFYLNVDHLSVTAIVHQRRNLTVWMDRGNGSY
jgi:putative addiction module component (TIGR02574 family)